MDKISTQTIARTIVLAVALINQVCAVKGWSPLDLDENTVYEAASLIATIGAACWGFWKNNSFTAHARIGDAAMKEAKMMKKLAKAHADDEREEADMTAN